ncbi:hypothetical protein [Kribbella swartbergensis]
MFGIQRYARPRGQGRDAWPRGAVPGSLLIALAAVVVCLWALGRAAQRSPAAVSVWIALGGAVAGLFAGYLAIRAVTNRWLAGDREEGFAAKAVLLSLAVAIPLAVLGLVPATRPYAVAAFAGGTVGLMLGNLHAIYRSTRPRNSG